MRPFIYAPRRRVHIEVRAVWLGALRAVCGPPDALRLVCLWVGMGVGAFGHLAQWL